MTDPEHSDPRLAEIGAIDDELLNIYEQRAQLEQQEAALMARRIALLQEVRGEG